LAESAVTQANAFIAEIELTERLIDQEFTASIAGAQSVLDNLNLEAGVASQLGSQASALIQSTTVARAEAQASSEAGAADFLGTILGAFIPTKIP